MSPKKKPKIPKVKKTPGVRRAAPECRHRVSPFDAHRYCANCRSCSRDVPCEVCATWTDDEWRQFESNRRKYASSAAKEAARVKSLASLSSGHTPPGPAPSPAVKPTPPASSATPAKSAATPVKSATPRAKSVKVPAEPAAAAVADTPDSPPPGPDTNNFASTSGVVPPTTTTQASGAPMVEDLGSRSALSVSTCSSSSGSRSASEGSRSGSESLHSDADDAESVHSSPQQQQHRSRARLRESPLRRRRRSPSLGLRQREGEEGSDFRHLWLPPLPNAQSWNPYGPPTNQPWPPSGSQQPWPPNAWNAPCAPPAWWQYPQQNYPLPDVPRPPAAATVTRAEPEMPATPAIPATQPSTLESELRLKITALEREADLLKLQMQLKEASSNDSTASLNRPTSVPFAELVKEVYKYLPEEVCPRDEVPAMDRSYGSGVLSQFVPLPKVALPQSSHLRCVARAVHSTLIGVAAPEDVPPDVRPSAAAMATTFFSATGPPPTWDNYRCSQPYFSRDAASLEANDLREKPPEDLVVKWAEAAADEKLARSAVITSSQAGLFIDAINAAATIPGDASLEDVKVRLASVRLLTEGAASAVRDSTLLTYRLSANAVLRRRDGCLRDLPLPIDSVRELRTRPINTSALFDNVIPTVRQRAVSSGHQFPKPLTKAAGATTSAHPTKRHAEYRSSKPYKKPRNASPRRERRGGGGGGRRGGGSSGGRKGRKGGGGSSDKPAPARDDGKRP